MEFKLLFFFFFTILSMVSAIDYSQRGKNWKQGQCQTGTMQSPINLDPNSAELNNKMKFALTYLSIENATLKLADNKTKLFVAYDAD